MANLRATARGFSDNSGKYYHDESIKCDFILQNKSGNGLKVRIKSCQILKNLTGLKQTSRL
jgi:hypothetical protein